MRPRIWFSRRSDSRVAAAGVLPRTSPFQYDLRALAAFRMLLALVLLFEQATRLADWQAFQSFWGVISLPDSREWWGKGHWSLYWFGPSDWWAWIFEAVRLIATVLLFLGVRTRLSLVILFLVMSSLYRRNPLITQAGDTLLVAITFFAIFLPLDRRYSLATLWFGHAERGANSCGPSPATAAYAVQVLLVWLVSGTTKLAAAWLQDGTALSTALHMEPYVTDVGRLWREIDALLRPLSFAVVAVELIAPVLILIPRVAIKCVGLSALLLLEAAIAVNFDVGYFWLVAIVSLVPLVPPEAVDRSAAHLRRRYAAGDRVLACRDPVSRVRAAAPAIERTLAGLAGQGPVEPLRPIWGKLALAVSAVVLLWNVVSHPAWYERDLRLHDALYPVIGYLGLHQHWGRLGLEGKGTDSFYMVPALLRDGGVVNLLSEEPLALPGPYSGPEAYGAYRWRKVFERVDSTAYLDQVLSFLCKHRDAAALDLWRFARPVAGKAVDSRVPYGAQRLARRQCPGTPPPPTDLTDFYYRVALMTWAQETGHEAH